MYGINVHKAVIENKEAESGITIHFVNEEYDKGEIILQERCKVEANDTPETLASKIRELEHNYFPKAIEKLL
jgi:phosphoribosylglycinamide formyltransferase-1